MLQVNDDLQLTFSYSWGFSEKFGLVRKCKVTNLRKSPVEINIVDGLQNIIPAKTNMWLQDFMANLVDAYKWNEIVGPGIGLFCLFAGYSWASCPGATLCHRTCLLVRQRVAELREGSAPCKGGGLRSAVFCKFAIFHFSNQKILIGNFF